jgi:hypothetical protein
MTIGSIRFESDFVAKVFRYPGANTPVLEVRPAGVDSHTGVEDSTGRKSREKVRKFLSEAYEAFELVKAN